MKKSTYTENILCSFLFDNNVIVPCGSQYGYVSEAEWSTWFPYEKMVADGVPKDSNKDNLSIWRGGRGAFVDCFDHNQNIFFDVKMQNKKPSFYGKKQELWAGSPDVERREAYNDMSDEQVVNMFIQNQSEKQIVRSLKGIDKKPYLVMFAWQEMKADGTWHFECVGVNATKYLKERAKEKSGSESKSGMSGLIYRAKKPSKNSDYAFSSSSARVEIKFFHSLDQMIKMGVATKVSRPENITWSEIM